MQHQCLRASALVALAIWACGPSVHVHTVTAPSADLHTLRSFRMMPVPAPTSGQPLDTEHPMLNNSITNRALRDAIEAGFVRRGYVVTDSAPDFEVASYASARDKLDLSAWNYGYVRRPGWWRGWGPRWGGPSLLEYTEGSVVIDVIDGRSRELLWRGHGVAVVSDQPSEYVKDLREAVEAILARWPAKAGAVKPASDGAPHA